MTKRLHKLVVGPLVLAVTVSVYRSWSLAHEISSEPATLFAGLLLSDGVMLGLALALAVLAAWVRRGILRWLYLFLMGFACFAMMLDAFIVLSLDERLNLLDLRQYLPETDVIAGFLSPSRLALFLVFLTSFVLATRVRPRTLGMLAILAGAGILAGWAGQSRYPESIQRYAMPVLSVMTTGLGDASHFRYADNDLPLYRARHLAQQQAAPLPGQPNMILLIVESLSSVNSEKVSGVRDWLPGFDRLSEKGLLFVNFFANHAASEGGIISLLSGFPPMHYPGARPLMFEEFGMQYPIVRSLQEQGYYTIFLTTTRLDFITMDEYLRGIGFDEAWGRDEVPGLAAVPRFTQEAPADDRLYAEALQMLQPLAEHSPWLMVLVTASSHLPYVHPAGGDDSPEAVWKWVDEQLVLFHETLRESGFYDNGVLLITGDHRQMRPTTDAERQRYGDSARARVPLLIIGKGIPAGVVDTRFFQQSDLFRKLASVLDTNAPLSPNPVWVKRYNRKYGKIGRTGHLTVFSEADAGDGATGYELHVSGSNDEWLGERPEGAWGVVARIHAQRAAHQQLRERGRAECVADETATVRTAYLRVPEAGSYWFRLTNANGPACLRLAGETLIPPGSLPGDMVQVPLEAGSHAVALVGFGEHTLVGWLRPGAPRSRWEPAPLAETSEP